MGNTVKWFWQVQKDNNVNSLGNQFQESKITSVLKAVTQEAALEGLDKIVRC